MITIIEYDKEDMGMERVDLVITSLMEQSDVKYVDFDIFDSESIDSVDAFYSNISKINTEVAIVLRTEIDFRDITAMRMFDDTLKHLDDLDCNIFILKYHDDLKHLIYRSDFVMSITTLENEDDSYIMNIDKSAEFLDGGTSINFKINPLRLIYFHPIYIDIMNNIQNIIFNNPSPSYYEDSITKDLYLQNQSNTVGLVCDSDDIFGDSQPEVFMSGKNMDNRIDTDEYIESIDNDIYDSVSNILDTFFREKKKFEEDINRVQTERLIIKIDGEEV